MSKVSKKQKWNKIHKRIRILKEASHGLVMYVSIKGCDNPFYASSLFLEQNGFLRKQIYIQDTSDPESPAKLTFRLTEKGWKYLTNYLYCCRQIEKRHNKLVSLKNKQWVLIGIVFVWLVLAFGITSQHLPFLPWYYTVIAFLIIEIIGLVQGIREIYQNHETRIFQQWILNEAY